MTDRELLNAAAKAAGIALLWSSMGGIGPRNIETGNTWNPLEDDGDALRLAVRLLFASETCRTYAQVITPNGDLHRVFAEEVDDPYAATRRAIVKAAAAIGSAA